MATEKPKGSSNGSIDNITLSDLDFVRHNDTDFDAFRKFTSNLEERYKNAEEERAKEVRLKNYNSFVGSIPQRWRRATLVNFKDKAVSAQIRGLIKSKQLGYFIAGPYSSGKTHLAYSILKVFVKAGKLKPSQIKIITESDLLALANGGFETRSALEDVFDPKYKAYVFDSLGSKDHYEEKREQPAISRLIEEAYNRSALFIATSHMSLDFYCEGISLASVSKMQQMVGDGVILTGDPEG